MFLQATLKFSVQIFNKGEYGLRAQLSIEGGGLLVSVGLSACVCACVLWGGNEEVSPLKKDGVAA